MRIYLFEDTTVSDPAQCYHTGGSVMVIAETRDQVEHLLERTPVVLSEQDWEKVRTFPTHSYIKPEVFIFPDSGCC